MSKKQNKLLLQHELVDRLAMVIDMFNQNILDHPGGNDMRQQLREVSKVLWEAYQTAGTLHPGLNKKGKK